MAKSSIEYDLARINKIRPLVMSQTPKEVANNESMYQELVASVAWLKEKSATSPAIGAFAGLASNRLAEVQKYRENQQAGGGGPTQGGPKLVRYRV